MNSGRKFTQSDKLKTLFEIAGRRKIYMQEKDLVQLLDSYMGNDGYYMKPRIAGNESSFFMAKGPAASGDVEKSFNGIKEALGDRTEKEPLLFAGTPKVECAVCADVPNLFALDREEA